MRQLLVFKRRNPVRIASATTRNTCRDVAQLHVSEVASVTHVVAQISRRPRITRMFDVRESHKTHQSLELA